MNKITLYVLALGVFLTATSELVVSGILPRIAADVNISLAMAGQLISAYSLAFAIATPIVVSLTNGMKRKALLLGALGIYMVGSAASALSQEVIVLMAARVLLGASSGVFLVVSFGIVSKLVPPEKLGSSIATIIMGFSTALILGVPIGIAVTDWLGWQAIFAMLGLLSAAVGFIIYRLLPEVEGDASVPLSRQIKALGSMVIIAALLMTLFREGGGSVFLTYITPYLQETMGYRPSDIAVIMLVYGVVGAVGSRLGGSFVDRWGTMPVLTATIAAQAASLVLLPLAAGYSWAALLLIGILFFSMFASGPAVQSYIIGRSQGSSNLVLSINTSVIHLGLAGGAGAGGILVGGTESVRHHPWLAGFLILLGLTAAFISFAASRKPQTAKSAA
ncbi:MFS transporter [Paenibacillus nanensis]|uniref:MFS transporter n=1 Tax=Paenibacillus nanensis TaxID=393251 RepID=A0A3A1V097_9BACL|nr:MFS transporter [Paenibacillus nanensis]RIX53925.1 MFS transporter [Paenibacillus nanensis]